MANDDFFNFTAPGAYVLANRGAAGYIQTLDLWKDTFTADPNNCEYVSREDYSDSKYTGKVDILINCAGSGNAFFIVSASPEGDAGDYTVTAIINSPAD